MADDIIYRQEAIRWVKSECNPYGKPTIDFESGKKVIEHLEQLPTAEPERKEGRWIVDEKRFGDTDRHCSLCGAILEGDDGKWRNNYYCYHCGAKMVKKPEWLGRITDE